MKIRNELCRLDKNSYASDNISLPEGGIDCSEGCNPYGYPKDILSVWQSLDMNKLAAYPHSQRAYESIVKYWSNQAKLIHNNIMLTDGSIAGIYIINNIFAKKGAPILGVEPQFSDYGANARLLGMDYRTVPMRRDMNYTIEAEDILDHIKAEDALIYIDNPNNPTGQTVCLSDLERIVKKAKKMGVYVLIDEAYGDFITKEESAICLLNQYDNLIVQRTMSKGFGLAGVRAGFILASEDLIGYMKKVTNPYMVGEFSRDMMSAALDSKNHIAEHTLKFQDTKRRMANMLGGRLIMAKTDDRVPICMIKHVDRNMDLLEEFFKKGILAVPGAEFDGLDQSFVRLRLPLDKDIPKLLNALEEIDCG